MGTLLLKRLKISHTNLAKLLSQSNLAPVKCARPFWINEINYMSTRPSKPSTNIKLDEKDKKMLLKSKKFKKIEDIPDEMSQGEYTTVSATNRLLNATYLCVIVYIGYLISTRTAKWRSENTTQL